MMSGCRWPFDWMTMDVDKLIAIDTHTHLEVSCRNPFDSYGEEYDRAADKYFRSSRRPTMQETIDFYREQKIGFVNFTVDAETQMGRRRIPNEEIAEAAKGYRVYYLAHLDGLNGNGVDYSIDHSGDIYLMSPEGKFLAYYSQGIMADELAADLMKRLPPA